MIIEAPTSENIPEWDKFILTADNFRPYGLSVFLNHATPHWKMAWDTSRTIAIPLPIKRRFGVAKLYQPLLAQQLGPFWVAGTDKEEVWEFLLKVASTFYIADIKLTEECKPSTTKGLLMNSHRNIELSLNDPYRNIQDRYNRNINSNLKRAHKTGMKILQSFKWHPEVLQLFKEGRGSGLAVLDDDFYARVENIYKAFLHKGMAETWLAYKAGQLLSGCMVLKAGNRLVNFFIGNANDARGTGAIHAIMDGIIQHYAGQNLILDFEGSDDDKLAFFYQSFGGDEHLYLQLSFNRLPWPFNKM